MRLIMGGGVLLAHKMRFSRRFKDTDKESAFQADISANE